MMPAGLATLGISTIDYTLANNNTHLFWQKLCSAMAIQLHDMNTDFKTNKIKHDLLMDGPVN